MVSKKIKNRTKALITDLLTFTVILLTSSFALSQEDFDQEDIYSYDEIVNELSQSKASARSYSATDPFSAVQMHAGIGYTSTYLRLEPQGQNEVSGFLQGYEVNLGIDLFSPQWLAEGSFRAFTEREVSHSNISLSEFDLKLVYRPRLTRFVRLRAGVGVSARYLDYQAIPPSQDESDQINESSSSNPSGQNGLDTSLKSFSTPASVVFSGVQVSLSKALSVTGELALRSGMISDSIDKTGVNASFRMDVHF